MLEPQKQNQLFCKLYHIISECLHCISIFVIPDILYGFQSNFLSLIIGWTICSVYFYLKSTLWSLTGYEMVLFAYVGHIEALVLN